MISSLLDFDNYYILIVYPMDTNTIKNNKLLK